MTPLIHCKLVSDPIRLDECMAGLQMPASCGGLVTFSGCVRNHNHGRPVKSLSYEVYESLALKEMQCIGHEACQKFSLEEVMLVHRFGNLTLGETAVFIAALAHHRDEAFVGNRYMIDQLKLRVPIWKKEFYLDAAPQWVRCHEHNHAETRSSL